MVGLNVYEVDSILIQRTVLGTGTFSVVYLGELRKEKTNVAVKIPKLGLAKLENVTAEISTTAGLNHRNVIKLLGVIYPDPEVGTMPWLITEYMELGTLTNFMKKFPRACNLMFKIRVTLSVASAMKYLSDDNSIVHGDLHSCNCLISGHGRIIKVADFGLSFKITNEKDVKYSSVARLGRPQCGVISARGARWKPPEWVPGENYRPIMMKASDVWCYGILLFELWNDGLVIPYKRKSDGITSQLVARGFSPLDFNKCVRDLPPLRITNVMRRCFHFIPACRPTFRRILTVLSDAYPDYD